MPTLPPAKSAHASLAATLGTSSDASVQSNVLPKKAPLPPPPKKAPPPPVKAVPPLVPPVAQAQVPPLSPGPLPPPVPAAGTAGAGDAAQVAIAVAAKAPSTIEALLNAPVSEQLNSKEQAKRMSKARITNLAIRNEHWPNLKPEDLWLLEDRKRGGFAQVPRTLSMMMNVINDIIKRRNGKALPAGKTYLVLWLKVFNDGFLRIDDEKDAAYEAGYEGERNVTTFRAHMKILQELGFIDYRAGHKNPFQYVLMLNPYVVIKRLYAEQQIPKTQYLALLERANAIGSGQELKE